MVRTRQVSNKKKTRVLNINKLDLRTIPDGSVVVVAGKRKSGKTVLLRDLLYHKRHIPVGMILSPTEEEQCAFESIIPPEFMFSSFDTEALQRLFDRQRRVLRKLPKNQKDKASAFVVLDDCAFDKQKFRTKQMREAFMNGRHVKILIIVTLQYITDMTPDLRAQADYVFAFKDYREAAMKRLYDEFFSIVGDRKLFNRMFKKLTQDYKCICAKVGGDEISDTVFWYKAKMREKGTWRAGSDAFWRKAEEMQRK